MYINNNCLLCDLVPGVVFDLQVINVGIDTISISWNIPTIPNGIITVYEIRYRESNNNGLYNITNTTNTQYSIEGLLLDTAYIIEVRAYTSIGRGDWSSKFVFIWRTSQLITTFFV